MSLSCIHANVPLQVKLYSLFTKRSLISNRKQLDVSTTECLPDHHAPHPDVAYTDANITVYSFFISQSVPLPTREDSVKYPVEMGQKRKRIDTPDEPSKIPKLEAQQAASGLSPNEHREEALQHMFKPKQSSESSVRKAHPLALELYAYLLQLEPSKEGEPPVVDEYQRKKLPPWFYKQLPSFSFPPAFPQPSTLAYVVVGPRIRGRIDGKKLNDLKVPFNALRGKLTRGETIQFEVNGPNGSETRTVRPEDCMSKSDPPAVVIILDVPFVDMIPSVIHSFNTAYKSFRSSDPDDMEKHTVRVVYHLLGSGVLEDERYLEFMRGFPKTAEVLFKLICVILVF